MKSKLMTAKEAVEQFVHDGDYIASGGFGHVRVSMAVIYEMIDAAKQSKQTFVNKLDFLTTAGYLDGPGARERAGLPKCTGPYRIVTQLGIYGFNDQSKLVELISLHPGKTVDSARENSSFELLVRDKVEVSPTPPDEYLKLLREEIDPTGIVPGK